MLVVTAMLLLSGCSRLFGGSAAEDATEVPRTLVPTFTPTPQGQAPAEAVAAEPVVQQVPAAQEEPPAQEAAPAPESPEATPTPEPAPEPTATPTPEAKPQFVVTQDIVNVRQGPGTTYGIVGSVNNGTPLDIIGKNEAGDWWQICCVNGEPGWIFGQLGSASDTETVAVAQNIPPAPAPQPVAAAPAPQPEPAQEEAAAPPPQPQGDPDAGA
ncbi:MAG: SH3 domain-containing protein, partial [Caldilineaceae bacterium]